MHQDEQLIREMRQLDDEVRWQAVQERDRRFDGVFVYGVGSTKIYCKPSCPSRRPARQRVSFFATPEEAQQAGFRACRRCAPQQARQIDPRVEIVLRACRLIEAGIAAGDASAAALSDLGAKLDISPHHLQRTFKSLLGISPRQYAAAHRLRKFREQLQAGEEITNAMYDAGYSSSSRLYENAAEQIGMTPATYRRGGKGMNINYTIVDSHLGRLLVAATGRGICSVMFGDTDASLEAELSKEYPAAAINHDDRQLNDWVNALLAHLEGDQPRLDLPADVQATAFQRRVWEELRKIPYGETRSYAEIAEAIGKPTATRAVARACATNPVSILTPCHRVIGSNGSLTGYRWGMQRKRQLLADEKARAGVSSDKAQAGQMTLVFKKSTP